MAIRILKTVKIPKRRIQETEKILDNIKTDKDRIKYRQAHGFYSVSLFLLMCNPLIIAEI